MSATSSKRTTRRRNNFSVSKRKEITHEQKLTLYLNDDVAMENAAVQRLQSRIKQTKIDNAILILIHSLNEEKSMADWIKTNTPDILTQLWPEFESSVVEIENNGARLMNASPLIRIYHKEC
jgi:tRNA A37 threonylcarbamoyladenosine synthetase subunit TsaC/SUA5/YrdC